MYSSVTVSLNPNRYLWQRDRIVNAAWNRIASSSIRRCQLSLSQWLSSNLIPSVPDFVSISLPLLSVRRNKERISDSDSESHQSPDRRSGRTVSPPLCSTPSLTRFHCGAGKSSCGCWQWRTGSWSGWSWRPARAWAPSRNSTSCCACGVRGPLQLWTRSSPFWTTWTWLAVPTGCRNTWTSYSGVRALAGWSPNPWLHLSLIGSWRLGHQQYPMVNRMTSINVVGPETHWNWFKSTLCLLSTWASCKYYRRSVIGAQTMTSLR